MAYRYPFRTTALAAFLFSLAGIPPTAGFIAKFAIFFAAIRGHYVGLAIIGILASVVSIYYYLRLVVVMFMHEQQGPELHPGHPREHAVLIVCLAATLLLGVYPGPLFHLIGTILP